MREQIRIVERTLRTLGLPWRREPGGKHQRFVVQAGDSTITVPVASSPRDRHNAGLNTAKQIRRAVAAVQNGDAP